MALILNIETATEVCSVALALDGKTIAVKEEKAGQSHARLLTGFIASCMEEAGFRLEDLHAVAVSKGPGSFTGLRIGVASAKGLCYGLDKPLIAVNTLQSMASNYLLNNPPAPGAWLCPMIDARRMEVYTAFFNERLNFERETAAEIIQPGTFQDILEKRPVIFFGDGMAKTRQIFEIHPNALLNDGFSPSAAGMTGFSEESYNKSIFEVIAYFEPFYLKDFFSPGQPSGPVIRP
jgi:tRNA threonylcarbamoyladenosine biosynthesis protein TsaB